MSKNILITGGAGFIGVNTAKFYLDKNENVTILDNFSRKGSRENLIFLKSLKKNNLKIIEHDIRIENRKLDNLVGNSDIIFHLAAQVAVTASVLNPKEDFDINALGTLNMLEACRKSTNKPIFIYSSTNKVYGNLEYLKIQKTSKRYKFKDLNFGVSEESPVDFHSPYGCSKGAADQYVRDYSRIFGLKSIVFRQSCIYGPHQFGVEDQGWIAWFLIAIMLDKKITVYGDGMQVRDLLYIDDLINAYDLAIKNIEKTKGNIYNIGGGENNSISVWLELESILNKLFGKKIKVKFETERPGDQKIFITDFRKAKKDFNWFPKITYEKGIKLLYEWILENKSAIEKVNAF